MKSLLSLGAALFAWMSFQTSERTPDVHFPRPKDDESYRAAAEAKRERRRLKRLLVQRASEEKASPPNPLTPLE